ncbi:UDP-glucose 4-epimerase GalE [Prochlorococcus sp. MIT 1307]|uniref:UDP-glucose 4-epimerase GalE n=1 Tax=Prochlorococcus sp. MIT 1307 TaxID=3096219 RepID=UPI002A747427|nr:UDP-glucose 4-epimerase GalE [Prochlorococcus sp. MIT 1307]
MARLLITGGAGFIGTHSCIVLIEQGYDLVIIDSFVNSSPISLQRVKEITKLTKKESIERLQVIHGDIRNQKTLEKVFSDAIREGRRIDAVIHFAGLKSVNESLQNPISYWQVNVNGTSCLLSTMHEYNCRNLIFSSSATLYGQPKSIPIPETATIQPINPYGNTKAAVEKMLSDISKMDAEWHIACLRYFNPIGAHPSGLIGEDPKETPNNLFPIISQVASGSRKVLRIYGNDWPTIDGTCIRDYIHVMDLARGHSAALNSLLKKEHKHLTLNLGTGEGYSVLEVVNSFEKATGKSIPYEIIGRRKGDTAISVADPSKALKTLKWKTSKSLFESCKDSWNWQSSNPNGFRS